MKHRLRIGVADDEPVMLTYYERKLADLGHQVVVSASDGDALLRECLAERPDLVITDVRMPKLDGIFAAEQLWHEASIPTILVSAHHDSATLDRALAANIMAFMVKPIKVADLEATVAIAAARITSYAVMQASDEPLSDNKLSTLASVRLGKSGYFELESAQCSAYNGEVVISGRVSSFYLKQLAQTLIGPLPGVARIDNRLEVYGGRNRSRSERLDTMGKGAKRASTQARMTKWNPG